MLISQLTYVFIELTLMTWDPEIFEALYKKHQPGLVQFAFYKINSIEDAKEIVQDVFINVWKKRSSLEWDNSLKFYLYKATKNRCLNYLNRDKWRMYDEIEESHAIMIPTDQLQHRELESIIQQAIRALPKKRKEIFLLSRKEELTHKEIAALLDVAPKTVENQIGLALKGIKEVLDQLGLP